MPSKQQADYDFNALSRDALSRDALSHDERALAGDRSFLEAWENGLIPWLGAVVRARQIRRANPALAAERQPVRSAARQRA